MKLKKNLTFHNHKTSSLFTLHNHYNNKNVNENAWGWIQHLEVIYKSKTKEKNPNPTTTITPLQQTLLKPYRLLGFKDFES
jgi:hypothetical protein